MTEHESSAGPNRWRDAPQGLALVHLGNSATYRVLQPLLLALLVTAFLAGPITLFRQGDISGRWAAAGWFGFFVSLQTTVTTLWLFHPDRRQVSRVQYRLAELVAVLFIARLVSWAVTGDLPQLSQWRDYLLTPLLLLDGTFVGYGIVGLVAWERSLTLAGIFSRLAMGIDEASYYQQPRAVRLKDNYNPFQADRGVQVGQFFQQWILMGALLVFFAALATFEVGQLMRTFRNLTRIGLPTSLLVAMVAYFLIGLWLLSQAHVSRLYARWAAAEVSADPTIVRQWSRVSAGLLLLVALVASFLPIGSTFALSRLLQAVIGFVVWLMGVILGLLLSLLVLILSPLLGNDRVNELLPQENAIPNEPPPVMPPGPGSESTALIVGGAFWVIVIVVVVVAVAFVLRERGVRISASGWRLFWDRLREWWAALRLNLQEQVADWQVLARTRRRRRESEASLPASPWRFLRVRGLPAREQIRFLYLAAVRRADERGVPRRESETPLEFAVDLKENWPEAETDVDVLTDAFLEARYSRHDIDDDAVGPLRRTWRRMRSQLRRRRVASDGGSDDEAA